MTSQPFNQEQANLTSLLASHLSANVCLYVRLSVSVRQGHLSMVVQLLKYGADPSLIDGEGCSCVHLAAQFGHTSIVAYLIAKGQVANQRPRSEARQPTAVGLGPVGSAEPV